MRSLCLLATLSSYLIFAWGCSPDTGVTGEACAESPDECGDAEEGDGGAREHDAELAREADRDARAAPDARKVDDGRDAEQVGPALDAAGDHDPSAPGYDGSAGSDVADAGVDAATSADDSRDAAFPRDAAPPADAASPRDAATTPDAASDAGPRDGGLVDAGPQTPAGPTLPTAKGTCPEFKEGSVLFAGSSVRLWVGNDGVSKLGPLLFYWYATNSNVDEVTRALGADVIADIKARGGMIAALEATTKQGTNTGNGVWYTGDFAIADEVLACAIAKGVGIDTKHIHASGFSAGGLQTSWMAYARSNYMASVAPYSGGLSGTRATMAPEDATNVVPAMVIHGRQGSDWYILDFAVTSKSMITDIQGKGGFALDCNHDGGHVQPTNLGASVLRFMLDHGYRTKPSPYVTAIPSGFPSYCKVP